MIEESPHNTFDANNEYCFTMSQSLHFPNFIWLNNDEKNSDIGNSIEYESSEGYILEVDLDYPTELHNLHNDLPFRPQFVLRRNQ